MALTPGTRLGVYEITAQIGEGGMGAVYRARDAKLQRDVALKVLLPEVAHDPERLARFRREAQTLAALNHPHIGAIHGLEESNGTIALVLELVEGPTLADRIAQDAIPVDEALPIAKQIAEALEAAHERGIIHRDLKPANIKLRDDGTVKVLDFGLAKICEPHYTSDVPAPTVTALGTRAGLILGTPAYMSPEQARGQNVDTRTDIWAFGCVLYEMLTGRPAFAGETASDTLARVLERDPDWSKLSAGTLTPPPVRRLLHRCLEKNPKQRLRDIGDARLELDDSSESSATSGTTAPPSGRRVNLAWTAAGLAAVTVIAGALGWTLKPAVIPAVSRLSHVLPVDVSFAAGTPGSVVAVAPDGSSLVYASISVLYRRALSEQDAVPVRGTEGAPRMPFFSPDGLFIGYWDSTAGELRRIALNGGTPVSLTRAAAPYGASWEADDVILYGQSDGIWRVSAKGGAPEQLVRIDNTELVYGPRLLPDGRSVIFSIVTRESMVGQSSAWDSARVVVQSLATGERTEIRRGSDARVLPTGHLMYAQGSALFAVPFDSGTRNVSGAPVPIAEGISRAARGAGGQGGSANYDISRNGTLVYAQRPGYRPTLRRLLSVDLAGNARPLIDDRRDYWRPRIAPDGTRVAVEVQQPDGETQVWTVDVQRGTATPLSAEAESGYVSWTPDSASVIYRRRVVNLYRQPADGSGAPQALLENPEPTVRVMDVSRDDVVAFASGITQEDIRMLDLTSGSVSTFLATPAREYMARFSPDGRWLAYTSNESGRNEVYVRPFPRTDGVARLVSTDGGVDPVWAPNGETLYYRGASGQIMSMPVTPGARLTTGRSKPLFRFAGIYRISGTGTAYDIHPDGQRFIMVSEADEQSADSSPQQVRVVLNWFEELKRLAPTK